MFDDIFIDVTKAFGLQTIAVFVIILVKFRI